MFEYLVLWESGLPVTDCLSDIDRTRDSSAIHAPLPLCVCVCVEGGGGGGGKNVKRARDCDGLVM